MKYVMLVLDGVADDPLPALGGKTPLEAARTPNLTTLARHSRVGLARTIPEGCAPGTDIGSMSLFGLDPLRYYAGRGPIEAAQFNVPLGPQDLAFRCNLVTVIAGTLDDYAAGHLPVAEAQELIREVDRRLGTNGLKFVPGRTAGYRHLAVVSGHPEWAQLRCRAPHDVTGQPLDSVKPVGSGAQELWSLHLESQSILEQHPINHQRRAAGQKPANMIWLWGQGSRTVFPSFRERFSLSGAVITAVDLIKGIGRCVGLEVLDVPGATGYFDTNYRGKAEAALDALKRHDFVFAHLEATDEAGHMGSPTLKVQAIEAWDRLLLGPLLEGLRGAPEYRIMVAADHATCCATRTHDSRPVPVLLHDARHPESRGARYAESSAAASGWMIDPGWQVMEVLLEPAMVRAAKPACLGSEGAPACPSSVEAGRGRREAA